ILGSHPGSDQSSGTKHEGGDPVFRTCDWIPAYAGMSGEAHLFPSLDQVRKEIERRLRGALLAGKIHIDQTETPAIAFRPFEIVKQRPGEIAFELDAVCDGAARRRAMFAKVSGRFVVGPRAVGRDAVDIASAVLGDIDLRIAVVVAQADKYVVQSACIDRPAHRGKAHAWQRRAEPGAERAFRRLLHPGWRVVI